MRIKKEIINKRVVKIILLFALIALIFIPVIVNQYKNNIEITGRIYFNKPVSWEQAYAYLYDDSGNKLLGEWPGTKLIVEQDYIYYFEIETKQKDDLKKYNVIFNDGEQYLIKDNCNDYNKIYNVTTGIGEKYQNTTGEWLDYNEEIKIGKIPTTENKIKNVIYMIGDGMGENHIIAGALYKGEVLNIQQIKDKSYVKTASLSTITDSAAGATALATGNKTTNGTIGIDKDGNNVENLIEYANKKGMKTGIVCTQILNHATPAGFLVHNSYRYNYDEIAGLQIKSCVDLLFGGGRRYFSPYETQMLENGFTWVNDFSELKNIKKSDRVIGTFSEESFSKQENRISLENMVSEAIDRLENENGFFLMIEGSNIDTYSHERDINKMLVEMIDFDDAVGVAISYVNNNPDTLLVITADHETGGLKLDGVSSKEELNDLLFTSNGEHTETNVPIYAYGIGAKEITQYDIIDNTSIYKFIREGIEND